jgi:lipopolysaccharide/colanic/teichoic acid biosynthesis glycosyltransferase
MSFVGPRPCLLNQKKLIAERKKRGVFKVRPGITGLAQIQNINMSTPTILSKTDSKMIKKMNLFYYCYYILFTVFIVFRKKPGLYNL